MATPTEYKVTRVLTGWSEHCCSKCGQTVRLKQSLPVKVKFTNNVLSQKEMDRVVQKANDKLDARTQRVIDSAIHPSGPEEFYKLPLNGLCPKCGNREPWGKRPIKPYWILIVLAVCIALAPLVEKLIPSVPKLIVGCSALALTGIFAICVVVRAASVKRRIAALPKTSLPRITIESSSDQMKKQAYGGIYS